MPNNPILRPGMGMDGEETDVKQKSLFARLKKLFSAGVVVRNVGGKKLKVKDTGDLMYATDRNSLRDRFNRVRSTSYNAYSRDFSLAYQAARIDLFRDYDTMDMDPIIACLSGDTCVSTLEGFTPIKDLCEKYSNGEKFEVWSWDNEKCKYTIGQAHHPRKTGTKNIVKIYVDNGKMLECTQDHRIMLIDGTYKQAGQLKSGDSLMPFNYRIKKYLEIRKPNGRYKQAHRYIYEDVFEKEIGSLNVHHKNEIKLDNRTLNLETLTGEDHVKLHGLSLITNGNRSKSCKKLWLNEEYKEKALSGFKQWRNSDEGHKFMSEHTSHLNRERWKNDVNYVIKMTQIFSDHAKSLWNDPAWREWKRKKHSETIKLKLANDPIYKESIIRRGTNNGRFVCDISNEKILCDGSKYNSLVEFAQNFDFGNLVFKHDRYKKQFLIRKIKTLGYTGWTDFKKNYTYQNHKVLNVEFTNDVVDVYDLTVDHFENFAIEQGIIVSNSALDIYSDECLTINEMGKVLVVHAEDDNIKGILTNLFYDVLNIEHNLWSWTRNMCKYGDFYMRLYISPEYGVYQIEPISAYNVERLENTDPLNKNYVKFQIRPTDTSQVETLESFECAHFRLLSDSNFLPYGKSMIEGGRRVWKQLSLLEDAMLINRIMRAPERRIFKIDVGNIPPQEVDSFMEKMMAKTKKVPYVDQQTGDYNLRFNLMNMVEDFYLPVRGTDSGTSIETLSGIEWTGIDDIEYVRNKMMAALKIPKAFLGYEEELSGKATLASEDVRFARTIQRVQRIIISELEKIAIVHLYSQGYRDESLVNFKIELTNPSTIFEKEKIEVWNNKIEVASRMMEIKLFPKSWVYKNVFNLSIDDVEGLQDEVVEDSKQLYRFRSIEEEGNDPAQPFKKINPNVQPGQVGGPGGLPPPDLGGGLGGGGIGALGGGGGGGGLGGAPPLMETEESDKDVVRELTNQPDPMFPTDSEISEEHGEHSDEYKRNRDQSGEKKATDYVFGEDPDGHLEMKTAMATGRADRKLTSKTSTQSPLSLEERKNRVAIIKKGHIITSLEDYLSKNRGNEKKNLIKESEGNKSIMDPSILLDQ